MNIYLEQNGTRTGPFSKDELREKTYSGEVSRNALARVDGANEWQPLEKLLDGDKPPLIPPPLPAVDIGNLERLRDAKERAALTWLYVAAVPAWLAILVWCIAGLGIPLIIGGIIWLFIAFGELWFAAYLRTNAVRVSATQLPEVHRAVQTCCKHMNIKPPEVYVLQHNVWNAFATKIFGRRMVVLLSGAVDSILLKGDTQQLTWLVGHEIGHHWAGHLNISQKLARVGGWLIWVNLWHSRRAELTCDRVGLYCTGSLKASQLALMNATVGAQLAGKVNMQEAEAQWFAHRNEFFVKYRTLYSTHPHLLARLHHLNESAAELGIPA